MAGRHEPDITLETGQLTLGKLAANSGVDIGDVDVTSVSYTAETLLFVRIDSDLSGGTPVELIAATASVRIYVVELYLSVDAQCELEFGEAGSPISTAGPMYFAQRGYLHLPNTPGYRLRTVAVNEGLDIDEVDGVSVKIRGYLWCYKTA